MGHKHCGIPGDTGLTSDESEKFRDRKLKNLYANDGEICLVAMRCVTEKLTTKKQCSGGPLSLVFTCRGYMSTSATWHIVT